MSDDDIMEFGFEDADHIKSTGMDKWKQSKAGDIDRISIISFSRHHDVLLRKKAKEKGGPLSNEERAELLTKIDTKLAERLEKKIEDLTEADRLDITKPKFWNSYTHYDKKEEDGGYGMGTFRCLSKWRNGQCVEREICCKKFEDPEQKVACAIIKYPVHKGQVDVSSLKERKYVEFHIWVLNVKKYKKIENIYAEARSDDRPIIDLKVELDGDPQYQKQMITMSTTPAWAKSEWDDEETKQWILDQGLRASSQVSNHLGFKMSKERMNERMNGGSGGNSRRLESSDKPDASVSSSYEDLLG